MIGIREFLEQLAQDSFNNHFSPDSGTPTKNIPPLDKFNEVQTVSTCRELHFYSYFSSSEATRTISNMTQYSASSIYILSQHTAKRE